MAQPIQLFVGETKVLKAFKGTIGTDGTLDASTAWATSNAGVCSVSSAGPASSITITGVAPGTANVTATDTLVDTLAVTVVALPAARSLTQQINIVPQ